MQDYKRLKVPPLSYNRMEVIQTEYCSASTKCVGGECDECLYSGINLELFVEWFCSEERPAVRV